MADRRHGHPAHETSTEVRHENRDRKDLSGTIFTRVAFLDVDMTEAHSVGAVFDSCTFGIMRMREADLTGARFEGATLRRVDLSGAWLHHAQMSDCDLRGSDISAVDPMNVELNGALIDVDQAVVVATALGIDVRPE